MASLVTLIVDCLWLAVWLAASAALGLACWVALARPGAAVRAYWPNPELALFFAAASGLAVHVLLLLALALLHLLRPLPILVLLAAVTAASVAFLAARADARHALAATFRQPLAEWLPVLPAAFLILRWVLRPLTPAGGSDALTYHLPYARFYLEHGALAVDETLRFPLHTHNVNLLYAAALIRPDATIAQGLHAAMGLLTVLGVYGLARHWRGWPTAVAAAIGLFFVGEFRFSFTTAFVDNGVVLYVTAAFVALALWSERGPRTLLWWSALFAGTAMGTKYFGALFTLPLGLLVLWSSRSLGLTLRFALAVGACGLFWYLRSWWISGNPIHPFAGALFGHWLWNPDELTNQMLELKQHGVARNWLNLLLLPVKLFTESGSFQDVPGKAGLLVGAFLLSCLWLPWQRPAVQAMQFTGLAWLLFWFWSSQIIRYLMLVTPLMSLSAAVVWAGVIERLRRGRGAPSETPRRDGAGAARRLRVFVAICAAYCVIGIGRDLWKVPLLDHSREHWLRNMQPGWEFGRAAEADPRIGRGPLLQFMLPEIRWFYTGTVYGDWMGPWAYRRFGHIGPSADWEIDPPATLHARATAAGIRAVVVNKARVEQFNLRDLTGYRSHFEIVFETDAGALLLPRPTPDAPIEVTPPH